MNKQQLASKIWEAANKMRSKIEANEYKDYILGFIFYKFLSDKEVSYLKKNDWTDEDIIESLNEEDSEIVESIRKNVGYFIGYDNLFSTWLEKGTDFNVSDVHLALSSFSRLINPSHKKVFNKIFETLQTGLSKLGDNTSSQTKAIRDLIHLIKDIPMDGRQDYDALGFIYEYLISNFASNAGKKAGEFYTPHEVSELMSEIVAEHLKDREEIKIYDPTSGSGSLLINIGKAVSKHMGSNEKVKYYAQELKENTYNLTRMNLVMRGILPSNIVTRNGDTLEEDWPYFDENDPSGTYEPLYVDSVVSNPPYSQQWNPVGKESDARYRAYGTAPKSKADYAFLLHDLYHLKPDGIMTIVLPHGVLFRGGEEGEIRKNLIENNKIDAIIGLPANIFFGTGIPTIIMVLKQKRSNTDVLIIDASKGFEKAGTNNRLRSSDIKRVADAVKNRESIEKFSRVISRDEIRNNEYNLNIPRYVDSSDKPESWDIYASMYGGIPDNEVKELKEFWNAFPGMETSVFESIDEKYLHFKSNNLKEIINNHDSVVNYKNSFKSKFSDLENELVKSLIDNVEGINPSKEEEILAEEIFKRLEDIPLVDKYEAYQLLDNLWKKISIDLEIIQTEGISATKKVDPNMIVKKKDGRDIETQEGWIGRIVPFELVQDSYLKEDLEKIRKYENRLQDITSEFDELFEKLSEDDKESSFVNDDKTGFIPAEVKKVLKTKDVGKEVLDILKFYDKLTTEEKSIKKSIKEETTELQMRTKKFIENLNELQIKELLKAKWITPLIGDLNKLPEKKISEFISNLESIEKKYETTFSDIETQIKETEKELIEMIDQLTGNEFDMKGLAEFKAILGGI